MMRTRTGTGTVFFKFRTCRVGRSILMKTVDTSTVFFWNFEFLNHIPFFYETLLEFILLLPSKQVKLLTLWQLRSILVGGKLQIANHGFRRICDLQFPAPRTLWHDKFQNSVILRWFVFPQKRFVVPCGTTNSKMPMRQGNFLEHLLSMFIALEQLHRADDRQHWTLQRQVELL